MLISVVLSICGRMHSFFYPSYVQVGVVEHQHKKQHYQHLALVLELLVATLALFYIYRSK